MKDQLNKEEKELLLSYEKEDWISLKEDEEDRVLSIAKHSLQKSKRINIRLSEADLNQIKARAAQEGMPYQTLVSSIIHKYVTGRLK
jgi:predicted DNA binding CopG/RHH family protein